MFSKGMGATISGLSMIIERSKDSLFLENFWVEAALATQNGKRHTRNEDRFVFLAPGHPAVEKREVGYLFGVMDGCGGYAGGAEAAEICARHFRGLLLEAPPLTLDRQRLMENALRAANQDIHARQLADEVLKRMATTATAVWLWEESRDTEALYAQLVHVGDSRAYRVWKEDVQLLTRDHRAGRVLTQVVGMPAETFRFDTLAFRIHCGQTLLIASDGLWKPRPIHLPELVGHPARPPERIVAEWLATTRRNGSDDDQTAIAVTVD